MKSKCNQVVPTLHKFLQDTVQTYNQSERNGKTDCAIRLEEFEGDLRKKVCELACISKHLFHVDCLSDWVAKNDVCPIFRT